MAILARLRVFAPLLAIALWIGVADSVRAAFPLWTQNAQGQFIIVNTANGKYRLAPHQFEEGFSISVVRSFAYNPSDELLWMLVDQSSDILYPPQSPTTYLWSFDPHTGVQRQFLAMMPGLYSLTYRHSDGRLYMLAVTGTEFPYTYSVFAMNPNLPPGFFPALEFICQIQPKTVEWTPGVGETPNGAYTVENTPPITLCFDPMTDQAYLTSSPNGEGWMFTLDVTTGETTTIAATGLPIAQTFEPMTEISFLAVVGPTQPGYIGYDNLRSGKSGQLPALPLNRQTSLAFVPMAAGH